MSRSHYSDDYGDDFPGQTDLYWANVDRAFFSRAGRAKLAELLATLDAMPVRELYPDIFVETRERPAVDPWPHLAPDDDARAEIAPKGAVCALGAWAASALGPEKAAALFASPEPDSIAMGEALARLGWPKLVVHEIVFENDDQERYVLLRVHGPMTQAELRRAEYCGNGHGPVIYRVPESPAARWERVRGWVARKLAEIAEADARRTAWKAAHRHTTPSPTGVGLL